MRFYQIILFLVFSTQIDAQDYHPFVKDNGTWIHLAFSDGGYPESWRVVHFMYGDTNVLGNTYKKVYLTKQDTLIDFDKLGKPYSLFREDSMKKVYFIPLRKSGPNYWYHEMSSDSLQEFLMFDFGVNVGDTLWLRKSEFNVNGKLTPYIFTEIKKEAIGNNWRKVFYYDGGYNRWNRWIEGIGHEIGMHWEYFEFFEGGEYLACYYDNEIYWTNNLQNKCLGVGIDEVHPTENVLIYPNPTSSSITIELDRAYQYIQITIRDLNGRTHESTLSIQSQKVKLNIEGSKGLYLVEIYSDNKVISRQKILKR